MAYTGVLRAILKGRLAGVVQTRNMFTGQVEAGIGETEMDVVGEYLDGIFAPITPHLSSVFHGESIEIQHFVDGEWFSISEDPYDLVGGDSVSEELANFVSVVLIGKAAGKRLLGRKFLAGISEAGVYGNVLAAAVVADFAAAGAAYVTRLDSTGGGHFDPGIVDKTGTFHVFVSGIVSTLLGTMRRRKPGLGI